VVAAPPQRLVRLTFAQVENTYSALLGSEARVALNEASLLADARQREFQALFVEGDLVNTQVLHETRARTEAATGTIASRLATVTGCTAATDTACVTQFLNALAEKAFRRPLVAEELASIEQTRAEIAAHGVTPEEAVAFAAQAILLSPAALYRTEFGSVAAGAATARLSAYEMASLISYFLVDAPPDTALMSAAASGALATGDGVRAEVERLLATPEARANLTSVMLSYYRLGDLDTTLKGPAFPEWTLGLRNAAYRETELFLGRTLWQGTVRDLVTSRHTFVDESLAALYGVTYPGNSGDGFLEVDLPETERAGLLSQISMMAMRSRPDTTSVVSRGLFVNSSVLCVERPDEPPPELEQEVDALDSDTTLNEREKAEFRARPGPCAGCHIAFDAYGLVLESFDAIGRHRANYPDGTPIDASVVLPDSFGAAPARDYLEFATLLADSGAFSNCLASKLMQFASAASDVPPSSCAVRGVHDAFQASDRSFSSLLREVALSNFVADRSVSP
jgi:hypothetical protein